MTTENKAPVSVMSLIGFITVITAPLNSFLFSSGYFQEKNGLKVTTAEKE